MTKTQAATIASAGITAGYQVNAYEDAAGAWHLGVTQAPGGPALQAGQIATANSVANAIVPSVDLS